MSTHPDGGHHGPNNFFTKYVFCTDHKVIGIQFTFVALLFVILGGLLALGVRYQVAWPNQNVPYAKLLPGKMTSRAPEANLALWKIGGTVEVKGDPEGESNTARLAGFPRGLAVTLPAGTVVRNEAGKVLTLEAPRPASVDQVQVIADYNYAGLCDPMKRNMYEYG